MSSYLNSDRIEQVIDIVNAHEIRPHELLVKIDRGVAAGAPRFDKDSTTLLATIQHFNSIDFLADNRVPLLLWLGALNCTLRTAKSPDLETTMDIAREVYLRMPLASQRVHLDIRDLLFPPEIKGPEAPRGSTRPEGLGPIDPRAPISAPAQSAGSVPAIFAASSVAPAPMSVAAPASTSAPTPAPASVPAVPDDAPLHPPTLFTLATAGAAGGGATMIQMVYFPVVHTAGMTEAHCFLMVIAAIPVGALGAVVLRSIAEELAGARALPHGKLNRVILISVGALISGGGISLLAHALADMAFKPGPSQEWLSLGLSGAAGSLCAAWSRSMARPTTVWRAIWTAGAAVLGTYVGYFIYLPIVGLLGGLGYDTAPLLALLRQSSMVAVGAFVFVVVTQIMMSLQLHGADAFGLRSAVLRAKPMVALVPRSVFPATVLGALAAAVAVLGHSCSFAMQAQLH